MASILEVPVAYAEPSQVVAGVLIPAVAAEVRAELISRNYPAFKLEAVKLAEAVFSVNS